MTDPRRIGGVAALIAAATFVFGFVFLLAVLLPAGYELGVEDPAEAVDFLVDHEVQLAVWYVVIYLVFGVATVALAAALWHLVTPRSVLSTIAGAFGLIWAGLVFASGMVLVVGDRAVVDRVAEHPEQAEALWLASNTIAEATGGGIELVGGLWIAAASVALVQAGLANRMLTYLGAVAGAAAILTIAAPIGEVSGAIFGLASIIWFVWIGVSLLRGDASGAVAMEGAPHAGRD